MICSFNPKESMQAKSSNRVISRSADRPCAWPKDPKSSVIRNGSRLNEIVLVKLDPDELDERVSITIGRRHRRVPGFGP